MSNVAVRVQAIKCTDIRLSSGTYLGTHSMLAFKIKGFGKKLNKAGAKKKQPTKVTICTKSWNCILEPIKMNLRHGRGKICTSI